MWAWGGGWVGGSSCWEDCLWRKSGFLLGMKKRRGVKALLFYESKTWGGSFHPLLFPSYPSPSSPFCPIPTHTDLTTRSPLPVCGASSWSSRPQLRIETGLARSLPCFVASREETQAWKNSGNQHSSNNPCLLLCWASQFTKHSPGLLTTLGCVCWESVPFSLMRKLRL